MDSKSALIHSRGLETRKDDLSHALKGAGGGSSKNFVVSGQTTSTNMRAKSTKSTTGKSTKGTSQPSLLEKSQTTTLSVQDFLAKVSQLLAKEKDSMIKGYAIL